MREDPLIWRNKTQIYYDDDKKDIKIDKNVIAIKSLFFLSILLQNSLSFFLRLFNLYKIVLSLIITLNLILIINILMMWLLLNMMLFLEAMLCILSLMLILITIQTSFNTYLLYDLIDCSHLILLKIARTSLNILRIYWFGNNLLFGSIMTTLGYFLFRLFVCHISWIRCWFLCVSASRHRLLIILCWNILAFVTSIDACPFIRS